MNLYPHQQTGVDFLVERTRAGLFDDMGLGKTAAAICAAERVRGNGRMLVVAPAAVIYNWAREVRMWTDPTRKVCVVANGRSRFDDTASVHVVSHALLLNASVLQQILKRRWDVVVLDEAHMMKNPKAKRTQAFYGKPGRLGIDNTPACVVDVARYCWVLTGTPMPNNPTELWTLLAGLAPDRIRDARGRMLSWRQFRDRYCETVYNSFAPDSPKIIGAKNIDDLRERMRGFSLRRLKSEQLQLPPVRVGFITVNNPTVPAELREIEAKLRAPSRTMRDLGISTIQYGSRTITGDDVDRAMGHMTVDELIEAMRGEEFSTWRRLCGEAKADAAAELIADELENGAYHKVVIGVHHRNIVDTLADKLKPFGYVRITGDTPPVARQMNVDRFQTDPNVRVAICQIVAGGVGITLTAASEMVLVEQSFVPGENAQLIDRINRIGQTQPMNVRILTLAGSVDEVVAEALARKSHMIKEVLK